MKCHGREFARLAAISIALMTGFSNHATWADDSASTATQPAIDKSNAGGESSLPAAEGDTADLRRGKSIFLKRCTMCHGQTGAGGIGPDLRKLRTRLTLEQATAQIKNPRATMPRMYPAMLSDKDVLDVAAFVHSL